MATEGREDFRVGEVEEVGVVLADKGLAEIDGNDDERGEVSVSVGTRCRRLEHLTPVA